MPGLFIQHFFYFGGTRVWTWGFVVARLVLYHISHTSSPLCSGYFEDRVSFFPGLAWTVIFLFMLPPVAGMAGAQLFFHWDGVLWIFCLGLVPNLDPPDFYLLNSHDYRCKAQTWLIQHFDSCFTFNIFGLGTCIILTNVSLCLISSLSLHS
jgi:hypothetical protein